MACQFSIPPLCDSNQRWILVKIQLVKTRIGENTHFNSIHTPKPDGTLGVCKAAGICI